MTDNNVIIVPMDRWGKVPDVLKNEKVDTSHYTAGIGMSWPTLTIKGKTWGTRFRGENKQVTAPNDQAGGAIMPVQFLDVVVVETANRISKVYYKGGYTDGDHTPPDCWSADGITPDEGASDKQAGTCRGCRHNVMNSRVAEGTAGTIVKGKACSDNKRLAIVSIHDIPNKSYDGCPLMLRLPPSSFANFTQFVGKVLNFGIPLFGVVVRLTFDHTVAHPKIQFMPVRMLTATEAAQVIELRKNPVIQDMLNDKASGAFADPEAEVEQAEGLPKDDVPPPAGSGWDGPKTSEAKVEAKPEPKPEPVAKPALTPEQQEIADLKAKLAAAEKAAEPEPEPEPVLTPEQLEIQALKARLAEAEAAKKPKGGRPRSKPVGPPANASVTPQGNGAADEATAPDPLGNQLNERMAKLVGDNQ